MGLVYFLAEPNLPHSNIVNNCFLVEWKEAVVTTLPKKSGTDWSNYKNLSPGSNLSFISKLTESAVARQIHQRPVVR